MEEMESIGLLKTISMLFTLGDPKWIIPIALCLVGVLVAAWKAPRWVREIGLAALVFGLLSFAIRWHLGIASLEGELIMLGGNEKISPNILVDAIRQSMIAPIFGICVFIASQIIALVQSSKR